MGNGVVGVNVVRAARARSLGVFLGFAGAACGGSVTEPTAEIPEQCIGDYAGSYSGDTKGSLEGRVSADAVFKVTFTQTSTGQSATGSGDIQEDGSISLSLGPHQVKGTFNFDRCRATGQWSSIDLDGNWTANKR